MSLPEPSPLIKATGTQELDVKGQILTAGPMSVELDNGNLRYIRLNGVEVLRVVAFLVRDENWGTYAPVLRDLSVQQHADRFVVSYKATCQRGAQTLDYEARIEGHADGSLNFHGVATPQTDFLTARTGFVVLHPLEGVVDKPLKVEHVDGTVTDSRFPAHVNPDCPFRNVRALSHEALPGVWLRCEMLGDAFEMEDHRNWTDASFKTYVRPLSRPWPYTLPAGEAVEQSIRLSLTGTLPKPASTGAKPTSPRVSLGAVTSQRMPPVGLGMPAEEAPHALAKATLLKGLAPRFLVCHFDPRQHHGQALLKQYAQLSAQLHAPVTLEVVVQSLEGFAQELMQVASDCKAVGLAPDHVSVCPVGHLKSVLPGGTYPPAPDLEALYAAARKAFPAAALGGGMFSFFTELNRKRPPAQALDFITNTTCPIVHAADDRSVMETLEALPWQIQTAKHFSGGKPHHVGPSGIGARDNPHGATFADNPHNGRVCLAKMDPRQRGLFSAAWTLGYVATLVAAGVAHISMAAPTGPLGVMYRRDEHQAQPWFDDLPAGAAAHTVYPVYHTLASLNCASGHPLLAVNNSHPQHISTLAWKDRDGHRLLMANLTSETCHIDLQGFHQGATVGRLNAHSFVQATTNPQHFRQVSEWLSPLNSLELSAYEVVCVFQPGG